MVILLWMKKRYIDYSARLLTIYPINYLNDID